MFGNGKTYFADSPVVINIEGLEWPESSPVTLVMVNVLYQNNIVGRFRIDAVGRSSVTLDISSALRAMWSDIDYSNVVTMATNVARSPGGTSSQQLHYRLYSLIVYTEYISPSDGEIVTTSSGEIPGGQCRPGRFTELERSLAGSAVNADLSSLDGTNLRFGDASTKPTSSPERVGSDSITSWLDFGANGASRPFVLLFFFGSGVQGQPDSPSAHAPLVLRDRVPYVDFIFVNRRGALETCSAMMEESMSMDAETKEYGHPEGASFVPERSMLDIASGGRRSWSMSSGHLTREWLEWWVSEFLLARRRWMLYTYKRFNSNTQTYVTERAFVPVTVKPAKKSNTICDLSKQQMESVEFTVTLALEG